MRVATFLSWAVISSQFSCNSCSHLTGARELRKLSWKLSLLNSHSRSTRPLLWGAQSWFCPPPPTHCKPIKRCTVPGHKCRWNPPILTIFTTRSIELHHLTIKRSFTTAELGDSLIYQAIFLIQTTSHQILCNNSVCNRVEYNVNVFSIRCTCSVNVDLFSIVQILIFEIFLNEITCVFEAMITCKIMEYIN